jgi:hypothetical protein
MPDLLGSLDLSLLALAAIAFALGGAVKGAVGLGLPTIAIALLATFVGLREAIAITIIPLVATNLVQVIQGGSPLALVKRFGVLNATAAAGLWVGTEILWAVDPRWLQIALGCVLILNATLQFTRFAPRIPAVREKVLSVPVGMVSGLVGGMTGSQGIVIAMYLSALDLSKDQYVQGIGLSFFLTGLVWMVAIGSQGAFTAPSLSASALGLVIALITMAAGRAVRDRLPQERFRQAVFVILGLLGANLIRRAILG